MLFDRQRWTTTTCHSCMQETNPFWHWYILCHCLQALHGECKTTTGVDNANDQRQPDMDKDPAKNGPQRLVCSHWANDKRPFQETHRGKSGKPTNLLAILVSEPSRIHPKEKLWRTGAVLQCTEGTLGKVRTCGGCWRCGVRAGI